MINIVASEAFELDGHLFKSRAEAVSYHAKNVATAALHALLSEQRHCGDQQGNQLIFQSIDAYQIVNKINEVEEILRQYHANMAL